ncbi:hypothetical protein C8Q77DRAFT_1089802 [Trametes polyzona]|nr:hypothetical protein C8Q77DRAFT_1089802 [Trametes polyzona]
MASAVRPRRSASTPELDPSNLNTVERLIFAQAVHEFGTRAWPEVAKLLSNHPLISQPKHTFTPQSCSALHQRLMEEAGLEWSEADVGPRSEKHLKLAQRYYVARVKELRELIATEETKFKKLVTEIDEIRSGAWDEKIRASISLEAEPKPPPEVVEASMDVPQAAENVEITENTTGPNEPLADVEVAREAEEPAPEHDDAVDDTKQTEATLDAEERQEEGSDNEAVDELIGNFTSEKNADESREDETPAAPGDDLKEDQPEGMDVDEGVEQDAEAAATPQPPVSSEDASQEPESPEVPISAAQDSTFSRSEGKRKASDADLDAQRDRKRAREESEPADEDEGAPKARRKERPGGADAPVVSKRFQNVIGMLHSQISAHRYGNIFHNPIKKSEAPDYHDIVKRPMDLKTIKSRVKDGLISNSLEFQRDIYLMFANAMMYNRPGSEIYNMAEEMMISSEREINAFRQTEGFHRM